MNNTVGNTMSYTMGIYDVWIFQYWNCLPLDPFKDGLSQNLWISKKIFCHRRNNFICNSYKGLPCTFFLQYFKNARDFFWSTTKTLNPIGSKSTCTPSGGDRLAQPWGRVAVGVGRGRIVLRLQMNKPQHMPGLVCSTAMLLELAAVEEIAPGVIQY